jgi:hypothetical protein
MDHKHERTFAGLDEVDTNIVGLHDSVFEFSHRDG